MQEVQKSFLLRVTTPCLEVRRWKVSLNETGATGIMLEYQVYLNAKYSYRLC